MNGKIQARGCGNRWRAGTRAMASVPPTLLTLRTSSGTWPNASYPPERLRRRIRISNICPI